jgi:hypothetical protein
VNACLLAQTAPSATVSPRADFDSCTRQESNVDLSDVTIVTELRRAASMLSVATPSARAVSYLTTAVSPHSSAYGRVTQTDKITPFLIFLCLLPVSNPRFRFQEDGSTYIYGTVRHVLDCLYCCMRNTPYHSITVYTAVFLKLNCRVGTMQKTLKKLIKGYFMGLNYRFMLQCAVQVT